MRQREHWLPVVAYEGWYEISDRGRVRRIRRSRGTACGLLRQRASGGRLLVALCRDNRPRTHHVHALVLTAFTGPKPAGLECRHLDGNFRNNCVDNLCWGTHQENMNDSVRHGTHLRRARGVAHPKAKLTEAKVQRIRSLAKRGWTQSRLAAAFGVHNTTISQIVNRQIWAWLPAPEETRVST